MPLRRGRDDDDDCAVSEDDNDDDELLGKDRKRLGYTIMVDLEYLLK